MKKILSLMLLCAAVLLSPSCKDDGGDDNGSIAVTGVTLDQPTASIAVGATLTLVATVAPENASKKSVTWDSSNKSVATVADGVVTGVSIGTTTITVKTVSGGKQATCIVTVSGESVAVTGVSLDQHTADVAAGGTVTLTATVAPTAASDKSVTWDSSNKSVATVVNGVVKGVSVGTTTITVTTVDGGFTDACAVTVTQAQAGVEFKAGTYHFPVAISETEAYWNEITITADNVPNQYIVEGLLDITGLPFIAVYDPAAMTLTLDGAVKDDDEFPSFWFVAVAYVNQEKTQVCGIVSGTEAEGFEGDCVISVNANGAPATFTTWLGLFVADATTNEILGVPEQILPGTSITAGAAPVSSPAKAPRKDAKRIVDKSLSSMALHF